MKKIKLIGDSTTKKMPIELIGGENDVVVNNGVENIGISTYQNCIWPKIKENDSDIIILLIGLNNIIDPNCDKDELCSLDYIQIKIKTLINEILKYNPNIIVESLYPTRNNSINQAIQYINEVISEFCYRRDIDYLDIYDLLTDTEGLLKNDYTDDGIYPNYKGYILIANQINDYTLMLIH